MITPEPIVIRPSDYGMEDLTDPADAVTLATQVLEKLSNRTPELDLRQVTGITTAFANQLFMLLFAKIPPDELRQRLVIRTANSSQRDVLRRSIQAVTPKSNDA